MIGQCYGFPENPNTYMFLGYDFSDFRYVFVSVSGVTVRIKAIVWDVATGKISMEKIAA